MVAIPGGTFEMGSMEDEQLRDKDEGPVRKVTLSGFWMAETEVTWDEYMAFFRATGSQGRTEGQVVKKKNADAISGATPPWGAPDQGWGKGSRPAITMTWHAATVYCKWLSQVTGKKYRLPTEAEWEYACRGGKNTPYFFEGNPKKYSGKGYSEENYLDLTPQPSLHLWSMPVIVLQEQRSLHLSGQIRFGLKNMSGNVAEFCSDFYSAEAYKADTIELINPAGPAKGREHVIRGGSFKSDAKDVRKRSTRFYENRRMACN